jgi:hypothetical protein
LRKIQNLINKNGGFSLAELMVAVPIAGIVFYGIYTGFSHFNSELKRSFVKTGSEKEFIQGLKVVENYITSSEKLTNLGVEGESFLNKTYKSYMGMAAFHEEPRGVIANHCKYKVVEGEEIYSILVFSSSFAKKMPVRLLAPWEDGNLAERIKVSYHNDESFAFNPVFNGEEAGVNEVLIKDRSQSVSARYKVTRVGKVQSSVDPYDGASKSGERFEYFTVILELPEMVGGGTIKADKNHFKFMSDSLIFPIETYALCVSKREGNLILITLNDESVKTLVRPKNDGVQISSFVASFANQKAGKEISYDDFILFPGDDSTPSSNFRKCIDLVKIEVELSDRGMDSKVIKVLDRIFFLNNFSANKPAHCQSL